MFSIEADILKRAKGPNHLVGGLDLGGGRLARLGNEVRVPGQNADVSCCSDVGVGEKAAGVLMNVGFVVENVSGGSSLKGGGSGRPPPEALLALVPHDVRAALAGGDDILPAVAVEIGEADLQAGAGTVLRDHVLAEGARGRIPSVEI